MNIDIHNGYDYHKARSVQREIGFRFPADFRVTRLVHIINAIQLLPLLLLLLLLLLFSSSSILDYLLVLVEQR